MNAIELLRLQFKGAHETLEGTMADVNDIVAHFTETSKALPVGAAYAHAILSEDMMLSMMFLHKEPLMKDAAQVGLSEPMPDQEHWDQHDAWARRVKVDLNKFKAYAQEVYKRTDDYLATLKDSDLDEEIESPMGKNTLAYFLSNFFVLHTANLTGEISAAKGFQGHKGYPF